MRAVIHALKFEGMAPVARELGRRLAGAIGQTAGGCSADVVAAGAGCAGAFASGADAAAAV